MQNIDPQCAVLLGIWDNTKLSVVKKRFYIIQDWYKDKVLIIILVENFLKRFICSKRKTVN